MGLTELAVNFFIALFALLDPIGNVPIFAAATENATGRARRRLALYIALFVFGFLTFFYFTGLALLEFFGISMPAFRIAGGILLLLLGLDMAREDFTATFSDTEAEGTEPASDFRVYARRRFERLIVPFGMPLLLGPGAISAVIIFADESRPFGLTGMSVGVGVLFAASLATMIGLWLTGPIIRVLGRIGTAVVVRVLGLVLCALAIQFIIIGLGDAIPGLIDAEVVNPYDHGR
jgi:multiple antibiotic resistance protein